MSQPATLSARPARRFWGWGWHHEQLTPAEVQAVHGMVGLLGGGGAAPLPEPREAWQPVPMARPRGAKAAFTLRLDADRHLRLRLACAVTNRSAQQIVTQALDDFLNSQPQVEALAQQVPGTGGANPTHKP